MAWDKEKGNFTTKMEDITMDNGIKIKWMAMVLYIINPTLKPIRGNGSMINSMEMELSLMKILSLCCKASIIEISMKSEIIGSATKVLFPWFRLV